MALFKTFRGKREDLESVAKVDGHAYFCTDDGSFWIDYTEEGSTEVKRMQINSSHFHSYTPSGTVSQPTFSGNSHDHGASFSGTQQTSSVKYTPEGTVSKPSITVTPNTVTVNSITSVGTLPSASLDKGTLPSASLNKGTLPSASFTQGTLPTAKLNQGTLPSSSFTQGTLPVLNTEYEESSQTLKFNFSKGSLPTHSFSAGTLPTLEFSEGSLPTHSFSAGTLPELTFNAGSLPELTFNAGSLPVKGNNTSVMTGASAVLDAAPTFSGAEATISHTFTPAGTISIEDVVVSGTVSKPTFTGTTENTTALKS